MNKAIRSSLLLFLFFVMVLVPGRVGKAAIINNDSIGSYVIIKGKPNSSITPYYCYKVGFYGNKIWHTSIPQITYTYDESYSITYTKSKNQRWQNDSNFTQNVKQSLFSPPHDNFNDTAEYVTNNSGNKAYIKIIIECPVFQDEVTLGSSSNPLYCPVTFNDSILSINTESLLTIYPECYEYGSNINLPMSPVSFRYIENYSSHTYNVVTNNLGVEGAWYYVNVVNNSYSEHISDSNLLSQNTILPAGKYVFLYAIKDKSTVTLKYACDAKLNNDSSYNLNEGYCSCGGPGGTWLKVCRTIPITITKANISPTVSMGNFTYGGTATNPSVSGNSGNGAVTYTYKAAGSSSWTSTKPTTAGTHTVKAVIAESTNYNGGECTCTYTVSKADISPTVSMSGWTYGGTASNPSVSGNSGSGTVTYQYKVSTAADSTYTSTKPTNAGTYTVKATIAATTNYNGGSCTKNFTISNANITPTVTMGNFTYGNTATNPSVSGNTGNGSVTYKYQAQGSGSWSTTKPTNAGTHKVQAIIAETTNYNGKTVEGSYTVTKADINPTLVMANYAADEEASTPSVTGNKGNGNVTYTYQKVGESTWTSTPPTEPGTYRVKATIAATSNYNGSECITTFTIAKPSIHPIVTMDDFTYGETATNPSVTGNDGNGTVTYTYKAAGSNTFTTTKPVNAGTHTVKAVIAETTNYSGAETTTTYTVAKANITPSVSMDGFTYGDTATEPSVTGNIEDGVVAYTYKKEGTNTFTTTKPVNAGTHTVKAVVAATNNYNGAECTSTYTVDKADITPNVIMTDFLYNTTPSNPTVTGNLENGTVTYTYKAENSDEFVDEKVVAVGTHTIKAAIAETANYNGAECTSTYTVGKGNITPTVSIENWVYSNPAKEPILNGNLDNGEETIEYKLTSADDSAYSTTVPVNAGAYTIRYTVAETDNFNGNSATNTFVIDKSPLNPSISIDNWTYGEDANEPSVDDNLGLGAVEYTYKLKDSNETYSESVPVNAGTYTVKAVIAETDNYYGKTITTNFKINKAPININISLDDWSYGSEASELTITGIPDGIPYDCDRKIATDDDEAYVTYTTPTEAAVYKLRVSVPETANYKSAIKTHLFKVTKAPINPNISIKDWIYGEEPNTPVITGNIGNANERIEYRVNGTYTTEVPTQAGRYAVRVIIDECDNYDGASAISSFEILPIIVSSPTISLNDEYKVEIAAGNVENDTLDTVEYKVNDGEWTPYTEPFAIYKDYTIKARETSKKMHIVSDEATLTGKEPVIGITAKYLGEDKYLEAAVLKSEIEVTLHYPNSEDEETTRYGLDNYVITKEGDNEVSITYGDFTDTIVVKGQKHLITVSGVLLYSDGKTPIAGREVKLTSRTDSTFEATTTTDEAGMYEFKDIEVGNYALSLVSGDSLLVNKALNFKDDIVDDNVNTDISLDISEEELTELENDNVGEGTKEEETPSKEEPDDSTKDNTQTETITTKKNNDTKTKDKATEWKELSEAKEKLSSIKEDTPLHLGDALTLPEGTTITANGKSIDFTGGKFTFEKAGVYVITLSDGTAYNIIVVDDNELNNTKTLLTTIQKSNEPINAGDNYNFPAGTKVTIDGKETIVTDNGYNFEKAGSYTIILPDGSTYTVVVNDTAQTNENISKITPQIKKVMQKSGQIKLTYKPIKSLNTKDIKYQVQVSQKKNMKKSKSYYSVDGKKPIKKLKKGKTYYVRARLLDKTNKKLTSKWSKVKKVKIKK